ncbi:cytokine receptor [Anaeramoeba ignava]|uniref:Cytokine receptor n=1 Tax=Anaeramoeba ignava TaxID=1746090 RepID=A0A9Q0RA32_ANAIG|nr:cytokine receptor [Anaeramoeba ignava]
MKQTIQTKYFLAFFVVCALFTTTLGAVFEWTQEATLTNSTSGLFGSSITAAGDQLIVGAPSESSLEGSVYIYDLNGDTWEFSQKLVSDSPVAGDRFGSSVSVYGIDMIVGAPGSTEGVNVSQGHVEFFNKTVSGWAFVQRYADPNGATLEQFGLSVAMGKDYALVGIPTKNLTYTTQGQVAVIYNNSGTYEELEYWTNESNDNSRFGFSVAITDTWAVVGVPGYDPGSAADQGSVQFYYFDSSWSVNQSFIDPNGKANDTFGATVAIDGTNVIVGAPFYENTTASLLGAGKVLVLGFSAETWSSVQELGPVESEEYLYFGSSLAISGDIMAIGGPGYNSSQGSLFTYYYNTQWNEETQLKNYTLGATGKLGYGAVVIGNWVFGAVPQDSADGLVAVYDGLVIPPQVTGLSCTPSYSNFSCSWDNITASDIAFMISYNGTYTEVINVYDGGSVFYENFSSVNYSGIFGNYDYQIQIYAYNTTTNVDGTASSQVDITTYIDAPGDLQLSSPSDSQIDVSWTMPNVDQSTDIYTYQVSYDNGAGNSSIVNVTNDQTSTSLTYLVPNSNYTIEVWACSTEGCTDTEKGLSNISSIYTRFGPVQNLDCQIIQAVNVSCTFDAITGGQTLDKYNLTYNCLSDTDSGFNESSSTQIVFVATIENAQYEVNVTACDQSGLCGSISTVTVTTSLKAPTIVTPTSGVEEFSLTVTDNTAAQGVIVSTDDGTTWQNFSSVTHPSDYDCTLSNIPGNVNYTVKVRYCATSDCLESEAGLESNSEIIAAKMGQITGLTCERAILGFNCSWNNLTLGEGLVAFYFLYNESLGAECLSVDSLTYNATDLIGGVEYSITVFAAGDAGCDPSYAYNGANSTTTVIANMSNITGANIEPVENGYVCTLTVDSLSGCEKFSYKYDTSWVDTSDCNLTIEIDTGTGCQDYDIYFRMDGNKDNSYIYSGGNYRTKLAKPNFTVDTTSPDSLSIEITQTSANATDYIFETNTTTPEFITNNTAELFNISYLLAGTLYSIQLGAYCSSGGCYSDNETQVKIEYYNASDITWGLPDHTGGIDPNQLNYTILWWNAGDGNCSFEGNCSINTLNLYANITNLLSLTTYNLVINCSNGQSTPSSYVTTFETQQAPYPPTAPLNFALDSQTSYSADFSWDLPADTGLRSITNYTIETYFMNTLLFETLIENTTNLTSMTATVGGLPANTPLEFYVYAYNGYFNGAKNNTSGTTNAGVNPPIYPINLLQSNSTALVIGWDAVPSVQNYTIFYLKSNDTVGAFQTTTETKLALTGLPEETEYYFKIYYRLAAGTSPFSSRFIFSTMKSGAQPPTSPQNLHVVDYSDIEVLLSWDAPLNTYEHPVLDYQIEVINGVTVEQTLTSTSTSFLATSLSPSTTYTFNVSARTIVGLSDPSTVSQQTLQSASVIPGQVTSLQNPSKTLSSLEITWNAPSGPVDYYEISILPTIGTIVSIATSINATLLSSGTTYTIQVRAVNSIGPGLWSSSSNFTTQFGDLAPGMIIDFNVSDVTNLHATFSWSKPEGTITGYILKVNNNLAYNGTDLTVTIYSVTPETCYFAQIYAENGELYGLRSEPIYFCTAKTLTAAASPLLFSFTLLLACFLFVFLF